MFTLRLFSAVLIVACWPATSIHNIVKEVGSGLSRQSQRDPPQRSSEALGDAEDALLGEAEDLEQDLEHDLEQLGNVSAPTLLRKEMDAGRSPLLEEHLSVLQSRFQDLAMGGDELQIVWTDCGPKTTVKVEVGDVYHGYELKECLGAGGFAESWTVSQHGKDSVEAVMKIFKPIAMGRESSMVSLYKECAFAHLAKQKASRHVSDCLRVGQLQSKQDGATYKYLVMEKATGNNLGLMANMSDPPVALRTLAQVFDVALKNYELIDTLRGPDSGVVLWHSDLHIYNLMLDMHGQIPSLTAVDYNLAEMCCIDTECARVAKDLQMSIKERSGHPNADLFRSESYKRLIQNFVRPCSLKSKGSDSKSKRLSQPHLDAITIEMWVRNLMFMLTHPGAFQLGNKNVNFGRGIRHAYAKEWTSHCGQACKRLLNDAFSTFWAVSETGPHRASPQWPNSTHKLLHSLQAARGALA